MNPLEIDLLILFQMNSIGFKFRKYISGTYPELFRSSTVRVGACFYPNSFSGAGKTKMYGNKP